ncbi:cell division protein FtsI (penicillin-binding protein 3) [Leucobacter luti]|uniref:peptidoglycan D,D-transpeptidase FtsI family protein n=2 Tax=Leucobacter luti TaxID=340320 RepID=UPI00104B664B|nr:penicillin-binding protein 2 [Leucobacter luti]MCW2287567.1 cell division protein FtsI (penicillin-binding protein 3) [Leucobacter luti]TCK46265.1 cell division protein FtsI (penicillin-binding protein 3) [Leucobacter luti]
MRSLRAGWMRRMIALVIVVLAAAVFLFRLVDVQVVSAAALNEDAKGKRAVPQTILSLRGDIVDRNGEVLATTDERYDVQLSPKNTKLNDGKFPRADTERGGIATVSVTAEQAFAEIGEITGQSGAEIQKIVDDALKVNPKSDFAYVKRSIDLPALNALKELNIPWLTFESHHTRTYPNGAVAGNIIGFSGFEDVPQSGVEVSQNECLTGTDGSETYERGADGVPLPGSVVVDRKAENGGTVELTIDRDLQWEAQQTINAQVQAVAAEYGYLVIMNIKTGELVAVAEDGSVDPNDVDASDPLKREARAFVSPYEPGSTFKAITAASLIEEGAATPLTQNLTPDYLEPEPNVRFGDAFPHPPMQWTLAGILTQSSNVGTATLGNVLSPEVRYDYLTKFGIGQPTNAGMPVEDTGLLIPVEDWDRQTSYNTMFGQGLSSTIIQTAGVYQALGNGGVRVPPSIVKGCVAQDGTEKVLDHGDDVRAVSEETAATMMQMLETVTSEAWFADQLAIPGYRLAGKTGTAEQSDGQGGYRTDYVHSFAGIFPADDPQYVAVASIGFPGDGDGSNAALTTFREAAEATIRTFHIPPSTGEPDPFPTEY